MIQNALGNFHSNYAPFLIFLRKIINFLNGLFLLILTDKLLFFFFKFVYNSC